MKKILVLLALLLTSYNAQAACEEVYSPYSGNYLGCKVKKGDKLLKSKWISPVINIYSNDRYEGVTLFEFDVDEIGRYRARTLIRSANKDCLTYGGEWGTQLYKVDQYTYAAWDEFGVAHYVIHVSMDGQTASSYLSAGPTINNISERNTFYRRPKNYTADQLLRISQPLMCK